MKNSKIEMPLVRQSLTENEIAFKLVQRCERTRKQLNTLEADSKKRPMAIKATKEQLKKIQNAIDIFAEILFEADSNHEQALRMQ